jgi:hypothetical protein
MTIQEALKRGNKVKRPCHNIWFDWTPGQALTLIREDLVADDWNVFKKAVTVDKIAFMHAVKCVNERADSVHEYLDPYLAEALAEELGL